MFSLICVWINGWVNNREIGDLRRDRAHYDVIVMLILELQGPDYSGYGLSQWQEVLPCSVFSHWPRQYPEWSVTRHTHNIKQNNRVNKSYGALLHWIKNVILTELRHFDISSIDPFKTNLCPLCTTLWWLKCAKRVCSRGSNWIWCIIDLDNHLAPNRRQAIAWINDGQVFTITTPYFVTCPQHELPFEMKTRIILSDWAAAT